MLGRLRQEWRDDRVTGLAAEVAFFAILALFPALLAVASMLGSLEAIAGGDVAERAEEAVLDTLNRVLSDEASGTIDAAERLFDQSSPGVLTLGLLGVLWAASRGFTALIRALDEVYDLEEGRSYARQRLLAISLAAGTVVVATAVLAMLVLGPLLGTGRAVADEIGGGDAFAAFWDWGRWPLVVAGMVLWSATIFHLGPNHKTPWRWDLPGAVLTAALWGLVSVGLRAYLSLAPEANQVFGALGGALIALAWLYLLALSLLVGGELNAILAEQHDVAQLPRREVGGAASRAAVARWRARWIRRRRWRRSG